METLKTVGQQLHPIGVVGEAWTAQLEAESRRFDGDTAAEPWLDVADQWERLHQPYERAWALLRSAECHVAANDKRSAGAVLQTSIDIAEKLKARPLNSAAADLVREARIDLGSRSGDGRAGHVAGRAGFDARELEVLTLVAQGRTNDQIAEELFISAKTASVHLSHILAKLGVHSRTEAAAAAHRLRLVP